MSAECCGFGLRAYSMVVGWCVRVVMEGHQRKSPPPPTTTATTAAHLARWFDKGEYVPYPENDLIEMLVSE